MKKESKTMKYFKMFADLSYLNEIVLLKFANQFFAVAIINK
jgi:hypothetical protein